MEFYYDVFGGSLRNLRSINLSIQDVPYPKEICNIVKQELNSFFGGFQLADIPEATWNRAAEAVAIQLQGPKEGTRSSGHIDPKATTNSIFIHWTNDANKPREWFDVPATRFMRHLAGFICNSSNHGALARLKEAIGSSGMGCLHEHDAHQFRLKHLEDGCITLWSLENESQRILQLPIKRVVRIRTVKDIERLEEGEYGLPTLSNFPFLDAVMKPHYIFQDTIAQGSHPSEAKIPEILKALKAEAKVVLVYTLGTDNFDRFKMNRSDVMKSFSQWKTRSEVHTDDVAVVTVLSRKDKQKRSPVELQRKGRHPRTNEP